MPSRVSIVGWWEMPDKPCHLGCMKVSPWKRHHRKQQPPWSREGGAGSPLGRRELVLGLRPHHQAHHPHPAGLALSTGQDSL